MSSMSVSLSMSWTSIKGNATSSGLTMVSAWATGGSLTGVTVTSTSAVLGPSSFVTV